MSSIGCIFEGHFNSIATNRSMVLDSTYQKPRPLNESAHTNLEASGPQSEFALQQLLRPYFGKRGVNDSPIGTHPDFIDLDYDNSPTRNQYVCTLFVDIKRSTRLSLLYDLDFIFQFKNAVIKTCTETVRSFDGHVHRLMGDAVMAFFGSNSTSKEDAIADAINCSVCLRVLLEEDIKPWMQRQGMDPSDFGFRVGCDFGDHNEVVWGKFGYENLGEVSATGLPVDMASKLQSLAGKNQAMLGQGLLDYIEWPTKYSKVKTKIKNGEMETLPFVTPNITDRNGIPLNYQMRELAYTKSLEFSALPASFRSAISDSKVISNEQISLKCFIVKGDERSEYKSSSRFLEKNLDLSFEVSARVTSELKFPLKVVFTKTNHGKQTPFEQRDKEQTRLIKTLSVTPSQYRSHFAPGVKTYCPESTSYRGMHTMRCDVFDSSNCHVFRDWIGVMIK